MIVRHQKHIQLRNVLRGIDVAPAKCAVDEEDRRTVVGEYGINEHAPPANLQVEGRVPHPDRDILLARYRMKIGLVTRNKRLRHASVIAAEEHAIKGFDAVRLLLIGQIIHHHLDRLEADELAVYVVRRCLNAFQAFPRWCAPEFLLPHKESRAAHERSKPHQRAKNEIPSFHKVPTIKSALLLEYHCIINSFAFKY